MPKNKMTVMEQYYNLKRENADSILFFRLGDFYEMFDEDARIASQELNLTLTSRTKSKTPMCGIPHHSSESYIARLIKAGHKVAIAEQTGTPEKGEIIRREVVRIVTPGTVIEESMLEHGKSNFLCAVTKIAKDYGICFLDLSTAKLHITQLPTKNFLQNLKSELERFRPSEVLVSSDIMTTPELSKSLKNYDSFRLEQYCQPFNFEKDVYNLKLYFDTNALDSFDDVKYSAALSALKTALFYIKHNIVSEKITFEKVDFYTKNDYMHLPSNTIKNLELLENLQTREKSGSLLWVLDNCKTAMGKRLLREWIASPLRNKNLIDARLSCIENLIGGPQSLQNLQNLVDGVSDIERLQSRILYRKSSANCLISLKNTLKIIPEIKQVLTNFDAELLQKASKNLDDCTDITNLIESAIDDDLVMAPNSSSGIIKQGFSREIDEIRADLENAEEILSTICESERKKTGIRTLKVGFNKIFGYYFEAKNSWKHLVPDYFEQKQTLANSERYITKELDETQSKLMGAKERIIALEENILEQIHENIVENLSRIKTNANVLAFLDVSASLAKVALMQHFVKPKIVSGTKTELIAHRHPVVENIINVPFVPNDTLFDDVCKCQIITGPNMAGKSTYMRAVAIVTLLAHIGSFVPAHSAKVGICDAIYTRIGASDDLSTGKSTFMMEMSECAEIINSATNQSLLIFDEVGRGTSTYDGMSIAKAILEYTADENKIGARTMFATHYHEITELEEKYDSVKNFNVLVEKNQGEIVFLYKIAPGAANKSYGIEVAKLAGIPLEITSNAKNILQGLEKADD